MAIQKPNSSGQGYDPDHQQHPLHPVITTHGYEYSHSTPIYQRNGTTHVHHTYQQGEHKVGVEGHNTNWESKTSSASGHSQQGTGAAALDKHLQGKRRRYSELRNEGDEMENENEDIFAGLDLNDATKTKIIELLEDTAKHLLAENIAGIVGAVQEELSEQVDSYLGDYAIPELEQRLDEENAEVAQMIVRVVDLLTPEAREKWYAQVAADARERATGYAQRNRGADGVPDDEAEENRNSLRSGHGRNGAGQRRLGESYDREANEAMRDAMLARKRAQDERFHANLLEYVERRDAQTSQGVLSRGVLKG